MILESNKKLTILEESKHEIQNRVDLKKLSNIQQKTTAIRRYGEKSYFDLAITSRKRMKLI